MERETGFELMTSSLGIQTYFESKSLARFCCEFLNLQRLAESAFSRLAGPNEAQTRHVLPQLGDVLKAFVGSRLVAEIMRMIMSTKRSATAIIQYWTGWPVVFSFNTTTKTIASRRSRAASSAGRWERRWTFRSSPRSGRTAKRVYSLAK